MWTFDFWEFSVFEMPERERLLAEKVDGMPVEIFVQRSKQQSTWDDILVGGNSNAFIFTPI